jgi:hypothetical protein
MPNLLVSFAERDVILNGNSLFRRRERLRFEWLALLAYKCATMSPDQSWASLEEIAQLPGWGGRSRKHIGDNLTRYFSGPELSRTSLVVAETAWAGPYRLILDSESIRFDVPIREVRKRLQLRQPVIASAKKSDLIKFTLFFARAQALFFQGQLAPHVEANSMDNAYNRLTTLAEDETCGPTLRLLACHAAADVLFRRGRVGAARRLLLEHADLVRKTGDLSLRAQFHLRLAWAYQRASSGPQSDREVKLALNRAGALAENSGDRAALAHLAFRRGGFLTKKGRHEESIDQMCVALEGYLITGNYDGVQSACGNLGSVTHRLGSKHYGAARSWLVLSLAIARWMKIGRDDAHGEMILGKMYCEQKKRLIAKLWLQRAERIARLAGGRINLADTKMVWAFYHRQFGKRTQVINALAEALQLFRSLNEFDVAQKVKYMEKCFPEVWSEVLDRWQSLDEEGWRRHSTKAMLN